MTTAGAVEACVTMPFEVIKTRQQYGRNESFKAVLRSAGGAKGLYSGLSLQILQNSGKIGLRFFLYNAMRPSTSVLSPKQTKLASGFFAGAAEAMMWVTPLERLKILRIKHAQQAPAALFRTLVFQEGVSTLWVGAAPTVVRQSATVGFRFALYDAVVARYMNGNALLGGAFVGAVSTVLSNPIDVTKSEMQSARGAERYAGIVDCVKTVAKRKGLTHFFVAGLKARIFKISLGQAVIFSTVAALTSKDK